MKTIRINNNYYELEEGKSYFTSNGYITYVGKRNSVLFSFKDEECEDRDLTLSEVKLLLKEKL